MRKDNTESFYKKMTETPVAKLIITLGIPTTISMLITNIYNMADTYFVGELGESAQGATGILFTLQCIIQAIAFMLGQGGGSLLSKSLAEKNTDESSEYASTGFFTGIFLGVTLSVFGLIFLEPFMYLLGSTKTILPYAKDYGMWVLIACPFMIGSLVFNNYLRYEGKAIYAMFGLTTGGILNIFGDWLLVKKLDMNVYGAGLSTAASQVISFSILLFFYLKVAQSKLKLKKIRYKKTFFTIIRTGFPALIRQGLSSISSGLLNNLTKPFGDAAIAAVSVVNKFSGFVMCVGLGVGQGFQPVAASNYSAKKYSRVKKGLLVTMCIGAVCMFAIALPGYIFADKIMWIFQKNEDVIKIGTPALRYSCIGLMFLPLSVPVNMLYQSIRKPELSSIISLLRNGLAFIPVLIFTVTRWGLTGIQISQPVADIITGIICIPFILVYLLKKTEDDK